MKKLFLVLLVFSIFQTVYLFGKEKDVVLNKIMKESAEYILENRGKKISIKISRIGYYNRDIFLHDKCQSSQFAHLKKIGKCRKQYEEWYKEPLKKVGQKYFWYVKLETIIDGTTFKEFFYDESGNLFFQKGAAPVSFKALKKDETQEKICNYSIILSSKIGDLETVKSFIKNKCEIDDNKIEESLFASARSGHIDILSILLKEYNSVLSRKLCSECKESDTVGNYIKTIGIEECNLELLEFLNGKGIKVDVEAIKKNECKD